MTLMVITIIGTLVCETISYIIQVILFKITLYILGFINILILEIIFNTMMIIIIYPIIIKAGELLEKVYTEDKTLTRYY